ncbi:thioredoxin family protein [Vibrio sp. SCSIO 43137]|uniref:thioredoxin family protein n=1 Tax=Vibrio sp. SCSIO 43137 TaxID=3021011 RepID=UPI002306ECAE|nr:thioredoxin family protein [Vibrio sp. SCSIO 43137]WCE29820.1 thioredoxin family protein [Vibrio sp. SCSIO 43137]
MKVVKVLGSGCKNCQVTAALIEKVIGEKGVSIELVKVEDIRDIMAYKVMKTPAVVIDEQVVHKGSVPQEAEVQSWF